MKVLFILFTLIFTLVSCDNCKNWDNTKDSEFQERDQKWLVSEFQYIIKRKYSSINKNYIITSGNFEFNEIKKKYLKDSSISSFDTINFDCLIFQFPSYGTHFWLNSTDKILEINGRDQNIRCVDGQISGSTQTFFTEAILIPKGIKNENYKIVFK